MTALEFVMSHPPVFAVAVSAALAVAIAASVYQSANRSDPAIKPIIFVQSIAH
jgi:hypothetical protein